MKYSLTEDAFRKLICSFKEKLNNHKHSINDVDGLDDLLNSGGIVVEETDPTVPSWAKEPTKPTYTADEVGALPNTTSIPTKVSELQNDSGYLSKIPSEYVTETELTAKGYVTETKLGEHTSNTVSHITTNERTSWNAKANVDDIPTKFSQLTDDVGYVKETEFDGHKHVWADITDRAFGEFPSDKGIDTVISNDIVYGKYVKVSDAIPTLAEVQKGGTISYYVTSNGEITGDLIMANFPEGDYRVISATNGIIINYDGVPLVLISFNGNPNFGAVTFPVVTEAGVYFDSGVYNKCIHSLTINGYAGFEIIKTIPEKYLPKGIGEGSVNLDKYFTSTNSNTLKWDGNTTWLPNIGNADFKVYGEAPTLEEASKGGYFKYEDDGEIKTFTFTSANIDTWNDDIYAIYGDDFGEIIVVCKDGASHNNLTGLEKGVYISSYSGKYISEIMFNGYQFANQVLKGECLPKHEHSWWDIKDTLFGEVKSDNGDTIVSDKVVYGNYHKVSDAVPKRADINKGIQLTYHWVEDGKVSKDSRTFDSTDQYYSVSEDVAGIVITYDGTPLVVISFIGSSTIGGWTFNGITETGTYFRQDDYYCTYSLTINEYTGYPYTFTKIAERYLPEDYLKQLVKEVIAELVGTDTNGLKDINGDELYDMLSRKLITKE